jgi:hypothetical protein
MASKEITMHLHWDTSRWSSKDPWRLYGCDMSEHGDVYVKEVVVVVDVPEDFDPREKQVSMLERQKEKLANEFHAEVTRIETEISKLKAIEYTPA